MNDTPIAEDRPASRDDRWNVEAAKLVFAFESRIQAGEFDAHPEAYSASETLQRLVATALSEVHEAGRREAEETMAAKLQDPAAVRVNYLRGQIACQHLIDEAAGEVLEECAKVIDRAAAYAKVNALMASSKTLEELAAAIRSREVKE